jgi:hypothetical protein
MPQKKPDVSERDFALAPNTQENINAASVFNREDPDSLVNRTSDVLLAGLLRIEQNRSAKALMKKPEKYLRESFKPSPEATRLRISFWEEYARAVEYGGVMSVRRVYAGIVTAETFDEDYLGDDMQLAYLVNIPPLYHRAVQEILLTGIERLRDIIELPLIDSKGRVQTGVVAGILKAVDMLDKRIHGANLQRVAVHSHHTQGALPGAQVPVDALAMDELAILEKQIADVRARMEGKYAVISDPIRKERRVIEMEEAVVIPAVADE